MVFFSSLVPKVYRGLLPTSTGASVETTVMQEKEALRACAQRIVWGILSPGIKRKEEEEKKPSTTNLKTDGCDTV